MLLVPTNLAFAIRLFALDPSEETDVVLAGLYESPGANMMLKRDIILVMAKRRRDFWTADIQRRFGTLTDWERRAYMAASYTLRDEGAHWRRHTVRQSNEVESEFMRWLGTKNDGALWDMPL